MSSSPESSQRGQKSKVSSPKYQRSMTMDPRGNSLHRAPHAIQPRRATMGGPPQSYYHMYGRSPSYMRPVNYSPIPIRPSSYPSGPMPYNYRHYEGNYAMHHPFDRRGSFAGSMPSYGGLHSTHPTDLNIPCLTGAKDDDDECSVMSGSEHDAQPEKATKRPRKKKKRAPSSNSFPAKLHRILSEPANREYIAWLPHGRAWRILKPKGFEEDIIPKYFRSERYASFMRQVCLHNLAPWFHVQALATSAQSHCQLSRVAEHRSMVGASSALQKVLT